MFFYCHWLVVEREVERRHCAPFAIAVGFGFLFLFPFAIPFQQTVVGALRYYSRESLPFRAAVSPRGKSPRVCSYRCTVVGDERERGAVGCLTLGERHSEGHWSVAPVACPSYLYALRVGVGARILEIAYLGMGECCAEAEVAACQRFGVNIIHKALPVDDVSHPSVDCLKPYLVPVVCLDEVCLVGVFAQYRWSQPFPFLRRPISLVSAESGCGVPVAAVAHIVEFQSIVVGKLSSASSASVSHPEAVEVAHPNVALLGLELRVGNNSCLIFYRCVAPHHPLIPPCSPLRRNNCSHSVTCHGSGSLVFRLQPPVALCRCLQAKSCQYKYYASKFVHILF